MPSKMAILVIPAALVVIGMVFHSVRFRGGRDTLYFFLAATLFGIARGNIIWWITTVHFESKFPYIFERQLLGVYHDSLTADAGWIICLYLGSYFAYRITSRLPHLRDKLFPMVSLACLFNVCLSYAVEKTAMTMGWWQWNLSTSSSILSDVPMVGIIAWFSVGFDFLIPYYTIRHYRRPGTWWPFLTLLIFPLHMALHLLGGRVSDTLPITPYNIWHWGMVLAVLVLPFVCGTRMTRPWFRVRPAKAAAGAGRAGVPFDLIPAAGFCIVAGDLIFCDLGLTRDAGLLVTKVPLVLFALLAVTRLKPVFVLAGSAVLAALGGRLFVPAVIIPGFYFALNGPALWKRASWLKLVYILIPVALTVHYYNWNRTRNDVDRQYSAYIRAGVEYAGQGNIDEGIERLLRAAELKPNSLSAYHNLAILYSRKKQYDDAERVLRRMLELRPISEEIHTNIGNVYMLRGDLDEAERWFRAALDINPSYEYSMQMLDEIERLKKEKRDN